MIADWERVIRVEPADAPAETLVVAEGRVRVGEPGGEPSIVLRAPIAVLRAVFRGETSPTEPYLEGTLSVEGSQEDVLRLDFLALMIWGA